MQTEVWIKIVQQYLHLSNLRLVRKISKQTVKQNRFYSCIPLTLQTFVGNIENKVTNTTTYTK